MGNITFEVTSNFMYKILTKETEEKLTDVALKAGLAGAGNPCYLCRVCQGNDSTDWYAFITKDDRSLPGVKLTFEDFKKLAESVALNYIDLVKLRVEDE